MLLQGPLVRAGRADDDPADLTEIPAAVELGEEPDRHRWTLVADHGRAGIIEHGAVLGDDGVEQLKAVADPWSSKKVRPVTRTRRRPAFRACSSASRTGGGIRSSDARVPS